MLPDPQAVKACEQDRDQTTNERVYVLENLIALTKDIPPRRETEEYHYSLATARKIMIGWANRLHSAYPQYKDHWKSWILCRAKRKIKTKGGLGFEKGNLMLLNPNAEVRVNFKAPFVCFSVWSLRTGNNYGIDQKSVEIL